MRIVVASNTHNPHLHTPYAGLNLLSYFGGMFFKRIFLCFILTAGLLGSLRAQKLYDGKFYGPYIMLFQLDEKQAEFAVKNQHKLDTQVLYTQQVGKISTDSAIPLFKPQPEPWPIKPFYDAKKYGQMYSTMGIWNITRSGYYIEVRVHGANSVQYRLLEVPYFFPSVTRVGNETYVFVEDSAGNLVEDAAVMLDTHRCRFDAGIGGYRINQSNISGTLFIKKNETFVYKLISGYDSRNNNSGAPRDDYNYAKIAHQGYMVTNKPKYKPGDSLFFKAYIVNKRAKPLKQKLIARMSQISTGKAVEFELSPDPKGAYNGFFVIGDSFNTDDNLQLYLMNSKHAVIESEVVTLENYELRDILFSIENDQQIISPGRALKIYATATNKSGLSIMDGSIELKIGFNSVEYPAEDSIVIPFHKWSEWYKLTVQTDPSGITEFTIPDSIFPALQATYVATATLTTADNEIRQTSSYFNYTTNADRLETSMERDTLVVKSLYKMESVRKKMRVQYLSKNDILADSSFYTPFQQYISPNIYEIRIFRGDTQVSTHYRTVMGPVIKGKRTHDSIQISFHSAHDVPVYYRIYRNNKIVAIGKDTVLHFRAADKSKNSYHLQYSINVNNPYQGRFYSQSFHLKERELSVEIKQPKIIYPGQEVPVEVYVKDAWGKPVNKVNLTAYAVNMQLDGIKKPNVPYLGLIKPQKALPVYFFGVQSCNYSLTGHVLPWHFNKLHLYENAIFHLLYPQKGFEVIRDTTPEHTTEIAFFNHSIGYQSPVKYVLKNDTLLMADYVTPNPQVLRIAPGTYNFKLRLFNRLVSFKDVEIKAGMKNFVCIHSDSMDAKNTGDTISPGRFTNEEFAMIQKHSLYFRFDQWLSDTLTIRVNGKTFFGSAPYAQSNIRSVYTQKPYYNKTTKTTSYYQTQNFNVIGPIQAGSKIEISWKKNYAHEFQFIPHNGVSFTSKDAVILPLDELYAGLRFFPKYGIGQYALNQFWWDPEKEAIVVPPVYIEPQKVLMSELPKFEYNSYNPGRWVKYSSLNLFFPRDFTAKRIWLFNQEDSSLSTLMNYPSIANNESVGLNSVRSLTAHTDSNNLVKYRLVIQNNDSSWAVKDLEIDSSVHVFLTLKNSNFRKLRSTEFILFDRMVKILCRVPFAKFEDTPTISRDLLVIRLKNKNGITALEGNVNGPDINYVVDNAFVILERNGFYVRGAFTNSDGRFMMDSLQPGEYMLKIKSEKYHYWIDYKIVLEAGKTNVAHIKMKPHAKYHYQVISNSYAWDFEDSTTPVEGDMYSSYSADNAPMLTESSVVASGRYKARYMARKDANDDKKIQYNMSAVSPSYNAFGTFANGNATAMSGYIGGIPAQYGDMDNVTNLGWKGLDLKVSSSLIGQLAADSNARKLRKNFKDHAYWIPNLTTNKKGYAAYSVRFPHNVTSWQTYVPAMDGKRHSGLGELEVKSYKPVSSALALPYFLTEGDEFISYGRIMNYTEKPVSGNYSLLLDGNGIRKEISVTKIYSDSIFISAKIPGSILKVENGFEMSNGYRDAQEREIPVIDAKVSSGKSDFFLLTTDTTLIFQGLEGDVEQSVTVYNQQLAMVIDMLNTDGKMVYPDNLSTADVLNALLIQKYVSQKLSIPFDKEEEIEAALKKLRNTQRGNGSFGFFNRGRDHHDLTSFAAIVLYKANNMGYSNNAWLKAARYYENLLPHLYGAGTLQALYTLKKLDRNVDYDKFFLRINSTELDFSDKLKYHWLQESTLKTGSKNLVIENLHPTPNGDLYVQDASPMVRYDVFRDNTANTYLAWDLLLQQKSHADIRRLLVSYLANNGSMRWHHNVLAAECIVREFEAENKLDSTLKPVVYANDERIAVHTMPKTFQLKAGETLKLAHSGAPVYIAVNRVFRTYNPVSDMNSFQIGTSINKQNDSIQLKGGKPVQMKVKVFAKTNHSNVVVEIPIPAGCVYEKKIQNESPYELHREYAYDRVFIYLEELPFGYHDFTISLVPKFNGTFHTAPARAALMFYSDKASYTARKTFWIH